MPQITRRFEFDSGHRVLGHEGRCRHLHGHRYTAEVTVRAEQLNNLGMVVDFGIVKKVVGDWINENFDHNMILNDHDPMALFYLDEKGEPTEQGWLMFEGRKPFIMPDGTNPTAERLAEILYHESQRLLTKAGGTQKIVTPNLGKGEWQNMPNLRVVKVRLYETPNCFADYPD